MCSVCGCAHGEARITKDPAALPHGSSRGTAHAHDQDHGHRHASEIRLVEIEKNLLEKNQRFADENRAWWSGMNLLVLNLISSPGAGKTSLLVKSLEALRRELQICVIEGDQETSNDAERIRRTGAPAVQINTGRGCHLDAHLVGHAAESLPLAQGGILFIENIGNLVCPSGFDLGETKRVVILSVTEGDDKPVKYPDAFASADVVILSKFDLLTHVDFNAEAAIDYARSLNPDVRIIRTSTRGSPGIGAWIDWLLAERQHVVEAMSAAEPPCTS
jgi:hydrogenase nickel incorporation protein HypB